MDKNEKDVIQSNQIISSRNNSNHKNNNNKLISKEKEEEKEIKIGNYIIKKTLGKGTFAKVKLAIQLPKRNKVAIKIIEKKRLEEEDDIIRLKREFEMLTKFNNPNVISVTEIFESNNAYFTVMEFCEGGELFNYIVENRILSDEKAAFFYFQLINGLEYIHSLGIVHRDLKPENLLLTSDHILKIIDFGLSNYYNKYDHKLLETPCGSPCYASPEMLSGEGYDGFKIDIWATGIILFAMLCGYLPFDHKDNDKLFKKILECKINYPKNLDSEPKDLIKKILVPNPRKRISIAEIKKHPFYLKGKEIFENNFSVLQISRDSSTSSFDISEKIYIDSSNSQNGKFFMHDFNHKSHNLFINMTGFSLKNYYFIKTTKSKSFEKPDCLDYNIKNYLKKLNKNKNKEKERNNFMKQIKKERQYLKNCLYENILTLNNSAIFEIDNIYDLCEKIINRYKKEQKSKIKNKFEKNKLLKNNFHKITNIKIIDNNGNADMNMNMYTKMKNKQICLSNDINNFNDTNDDKGKTINNSNNKDKRIKTEILQTQKKVDNLNDILKHKISYLNRKQKNKSNINEQNIKVNLKKTTPIKFLLNELLIKQKKSKMNKLPKKIKEKILEQNQKTEKGTNPKIQKIKNLISAINQQTKKQNINIISKQNIIHHHTTNITNLTKTNYYSNIIINNPKRSNEDKNTSCSPKNSRLSNNNIQKPNKKMQARKYFKQIKTISTENIKKPRLKSNLKKKIFFDDNIIKKINKQNTKNANTNGNNTLRIQDIDKIYGNVTIREKKPINESNSIRIKIFQNDKNKTKLNPNINKFNIINNINNKNHKNKCLKNKENISIEYSLRNTKNTDLTTSYDKLNSYLNSCLNANNSVENPQNDFYRKKNFENINKKKLNLNLNHLDKFFNNKNIYYLDNNISNYTDRNIINNSNSKKGQNMKKINFFNINNNNKNINCPKLNLKELLSLSNHPKKENTVSLNFINHQHQTQRDKIIRDTKSKNNKNIYKYSNAYRSKEEILSSSDRSKLWNMTSNQIFDNYLKKINTNFLRNKKCFLNIKNNINSNNIKKNNMTTDSIKFNKTSAKIQKVLNTVQNQNKIHETYFKIIDDNDKNNQINTSNNNRGIDTARIKRKKISHNPNIIIDKVSTINKPNIDSKFTLLKNKKDFYRNRKLLLNNKSIEIRTDNNNKKFFNPNILINTKKNNEKINKNINNKSVSIQNIINNANFLNLKNYKYNVFNTESNSNNNEKKETMNFSQTVRNNKIIQPNKINLFQKTKKIHK